MVDFDAFRAAVRELQPRCALVLGSGLADAAAAFQGQAVLSYAEVPGLFAPSVPGHRGQLAVGTWDGVPVLVAYGRVHFYEGHPWPRVTCLVELFAQLGIRNLILTNAAGGLRHDLNPGDLMAISGHVTLLDGDAWKSLDVIRQPYRQLATSLPQGVYAALTGPCYETPAEIRALQSLGIAAVGMSTAREAEAAAKLGLSVAGVSCITNKAAGLSTERLSHFGVESTAKTAVRKLGRVLQALLLAMPDAQA